MKNQNKSNFCIAIAFAVMLSVFITSSAFGWGKKTHEKLTGQAIENPQVTGWFVPYLQNNLGFKKHVEELLPYKRLGWFKRSEQTKIKDILTDGAQREDAWPFPPYPYTNRARNHFHSPLKATDEVGQSGVPGGESALAWARGDSGNNEYSWAEARQYYKEAFEALSGPDEDTRQVEFEEKMALTFASLGQVMHLIQDMAVPAHTRNDSWVGHIRSIGNNLEKFLKSNPDLVPTHGAPAEIPAFINRPLA